MKNLFYTKRLLLPISIIIVFIILPSLLMTINAQANVAQLPTEYQISASYTAIKNGKIVKRNDFNNICWAFLTNTNQDEIVAFLMDHNLKFGETVILHKSLLYEVIKDGNKLAKIIDRMYRHYVINTNGPIPESALHLTPTDVGEDFNVYVELAQYANLMNAKISFQNETLVLQIGNRTIYDIDSDIKNNQTTALVLRLLGQQINKARYGRADVIPSSIFNFDERTNKYSKQNAMIFADLAQLAYLEKEFVQDQITNWEYSSFTWIENRASDTQAYIVTKGNSVIVCFRGTSSVKDWTRDLNIKKVPNYYSRQGKLHVGFKGGVDSVWDQIINTLQKVGRNKNIYFTGHSLGAALTQIAAYRLSIENQYNVAGVYAFGSPRVGNKDFKNTYNALLQKKTHLHINNTDFITQVPPVFFGFKQMADKLWQFDHGHKIRNTPDIADDYTGIEVDEIGQLERFTIDQVNKDFDKATDIILKNRAFLATNTGNISDALYGEVTQFEKGGFDEHGIEQYLFKLACSIVDDEYNLIKKRINR